MKKFFKTTIDSSVEELHTLIFSAGKIGYQVELSLDELRKVIRLQISNLV